MKCTRRKTFLRGFLMASMLMLVVGGAQCAAQVVRPDWAPALTTVNALESIDAPVGVQNSTSATQPAVSGVQLASHEVIDEESAVELPVTEKPRISTAEFASQLPDDESSLVPFVEVLQWTVVVLLIAVVAVLTLKKYGKPGSFPTRSSVIAHLGTLPVKNHFQAHVLEVGSQKFLVTTDRTGVKTVNAIASWDEFDATLSEPAANAATAA